MDVSSTCPQVVHWTVFTASYRKVADRVGAVSGVTSILWDLKDDRGQDVSDGIYFLRIEGDGGSPAKIVVLR